jgi:kynurenine 3-monooxygenase
MTLTLEDRSTGSTQQRSCQRLIGADGAHSAVRRAMVGSGVAEFAVGALDFGYKELPVSVEQAHDMRLECLHLWPRRSFSMIANPNPDRSFSCTLFMAHDGREPSFGRLKEASDVQALFRQHFPDAFERMPSLAADFFARPTGGIPTVSGGPWHVEDKVLLIGDAAHALVPFFAQGMNSAFEDCSVLIECLDLCKDRWDQALPAFFQARKANVDAIADMAMQNYREIQDYIADDAFLVRKRVEHELMHGYPELYTSMHVLVMFTTVPYVFARACGALQGKLLDEICGGATSIQQIDWPAVEPLLKKYAEEVRRQRDAIPADQTIGAA